MGLPALCALLFACGAKDHAPPPLQQGSTGRAGAGQGGNGGSGAGNGGGFSDGGAAGSLGMSGSGAGSAGSSQGPSCIPRQECRSYCAAFGPDPSSCGLGSAAQCACVCEQRFNGPCPDELAALLGCVGSTPSVDCALRGRIFAGCEQQSFDLELCDFRAREQLCARPYPRCLTYCKATVLSACPIGPESLNSCLCGCEASLVSRCEAQFDAFMDCAADAPTFSCDADGRAQAATCLSEAQALNTCVYGAPPASPDAGN